MSSPEEIQAVWSRAISRFPQLAKKWGSQLPADTATVNAALTQYQSYLSPVGGQLVEDPTYFSTDYWKDIGTNLLKGISGTGKFLTEPRANWKEYMESLSEAEQKQVEEAGGLSFKQKAIADLTAIVPAAQAIESAFAPASGMVAMSPLMREPGVKERYDVLQERDKPPGLKGDVQQFFDVKGTLENLASAYQQAINAGELPWWKQMISEAGGEMLAGGVIGAPAKLALRVGTGKPIVTPLMRSKGLDVLTDVTTPSYTPPVTDLGTQYFQPQTAGAWSRFADDLGQQFAPTVDITPPPSRVMPSDVGAVQPSLPFEYQQDMFNPFGAPLADVPAEDLLIRQMDEPSMIWDPAVAVGRTTTPSGRRRGVLQPDVTKAEARQAAEAEPTYIRDRLEVGKDIQDASQFDALIPENVKATIDRLLGYRQKGIDHTVTNPGHKRWVSQWTDEIAQAMFGDTSQASRNKVAAYIDTLPGQQELPFEDYGTLQARFKRQVNEGQQALFIEDVGSVEPIDNEWTRFVNDFYGYDEAANVYKPKPNRPLPPTKKSWMGVKLESALSELIDQTAPKRGVIPVTKTIPDGINRYGQPDKGFDPSIGKELQEKWYRTLAGLNPFLSGDLHENLGRYRSGFHPEAEAKARAAGWIEGNTSRENMEIANKFSDEADELAKQAGKTPLEKTPQNVFETTSGHMVRKAMPDMSKVSDWVKGKHQVEGYIFDNARKVWREVAATNEISSKQGFLGYFKKGVEAPFRTIARLYEGTQKAHGDYMLDTVKNGSDELEELGWIDKDGNVFNEAIGTVQEPGDLRLLYYALHDTKWLPNVEEMAARYGAKRELVMRQYHNLRALTDMESTLREDGGLKLKNFDHIGTNSEQYFYRGLVPVDLDWKKFHNKIDNYNNANRIGRTQSIEFKRRSADLPQLMKFGLKQLYWNPYKQSMFSSKLGLKVRMEAEMLNILRHPTIHQADFIPKVRNGQDTPEYLKYLEDGWEEFPEGGPAFQGKTSYTFNKMLGNDTKLQADKVIDGVPVTIDPNTGAVESMNEVWMFHPEALKGLRLFFGDPNITERIFRYQVSTPRGKKVFGKTVPETEIALDDLIFIPKAIDLFGSFFQQVDFGLRGVFSGPSSTFESLYYTLRDVLPRRAGGQWEQGIITPKQALPEIVEAFGHTARMPNHVYKMGKAFVSKGYREELRKMMLSRDEWYPDSPHLKGYHNQRSRELGLNTRDDSIFISKEDGVALTEEVKKELMSELGWKTVPKKVGQALVTLKNMIQDGLFEGIYPAAIYHDYRYNVIPIVQKANRNQTVLMNPDQVMSTAAKLVNINWSVIPQSQSVIRGNLKSLLKRLMFSINEQETFHRQFTGMFTGENKPFWITRNLGALVSMYLVSETIHRATTGESLPKERLNPITINTENNPVGNFISGIPGANRVISEEMAQRIYPFGYADKFLQPALPLKGRDGNWVSWDIMGQYDTIFRTLDGQYNFPIIGSIASRLSTTPRQIVEWFDSKDFRGRDIGQYGIGQKILHSTFQLFTPIGIGMLVSALVTRSLGEKNLPTIGNPSNPILAPGATVEDIFPTEEPMLGNLALAVQGLTGLNLKASTGQELNDLMTRNVRLLLEEKFGKEYSSWEDVDNDTEHGAEAKLLILNAPENAQIVNEKELRRKEGYGTWYDEGAKWTFEIQELGYKKYNKEVALVNQYANDSLYNNDLWTHQGGTKEPWSPTDFNKALSLINYGHNVAVESVTEQKGIDSVTAWAIAGQKEMPKRSEYPIRWAIWHYFDIRKKHQDATGKTNWDTFEPEWLAFTSQWDDEEAKETGGLLERFDAYLELRPLVNGNHDFLVQERYDQIRELDKAGYWQDGIKYDPDTGEPVQDEFFQRLSMLDQGHASELARLGMTASEVWDKYLSEDVSTRRLMRSDEIPANYAISAIIKTMELVRKNHRYNMLMSNPELDRTVIKWFGNIPTHPMNVAYYEGLYGKPPSQTRQPPYR